MYISTKDWKNYIDKMRALNEKAADAIVTYVQKNGFGNTDELIGFANSVVQKYGGGSAALAAAMYDATAEASGQFYDPAEPAPLPEYGEVAKTVQGTLKRSRNVNELGGAVSRLVKRAGADTTLQNAYRDRPKYGKKRNTGAQVAWVPMGDTCPFCLMLASNGWRNQTVGGAQNHAKHIHANCDCNYAVRFDNHSGVQGYDPDKYKEMFDNVEGDTWSQKVNSMRRENYEKNKDQINAKKRAAYALRTSENNAKIKGAANTGKGKEVKYDSDAIFKINIPSYSDKVNNQLSASARKVAEQGSLDRYEYSALIDLETGEEVDFGSSKEYSSVDYYYDYLESHPGGRFAMVHNHNTENGISLPDIQEVAMWENLDSVTAVTNNGITHSIISNGKMPEDYFFIEFESVGRKGDGTLDEIEMIPYAIKKYTKGEYYYDGRKKRDN